MHKLATNGLVLWGSWHWKWTHHNVCGCEQYLNSLCADGGTNMHNNGRGHSLHLCPHAAMCTEKCSLVHRPRSVGWDMLFGSAHLNADNIIVVQ